MKQVVQLMVVAAAAFVAFVAFVALVILDSLATPLGSCCIKIEFSLVRW